VLASCFVSLASPSWGANPQVHRIGIHKLAFGPAPDGLNVNDIVEWTNSDILRHTATATDGSFDIDLPAGATGSRVVLPSDIVGSPTGSPSARWAPSGPGMAAITVFNLNPDVAATRQKGSNGGAAGPGKRVKHKFAPL
jgi:plastocyanin